MTPHEYLDQTHSQAVQSLLDFLRISSISTQPKHARDVRQAAEWCQSYLRKIGLQAELWETARHPAAYGEWLGAGPDKPTVLVYGHHDVQPVGELDKWTQPPFEPVIRDDRIYARGAADDKGQIFAQVLAIEAYLKTQNACPVNIKVLIEGEEEIGSPNLPALLAERRERLSCDVVILSDSAVYAPDQPALALGTRGLLGLEVKITGPSRDLHSGVFGGSVPNPIAVLARMLAQLHDEDGRVNVPGFYDDVDPLPPEEKLAWQSLSFDAQQYAAMLGCGLAGEKGFSTLERRWARPTLEFNGITGGYQGPGSNTIVPSFASCKITCRLVPRQDAEKIRQAVAARLRELCPGTVQIEIDEGKAGAAAYAIPPTHTALDAAARAFARVYGVAPVKIREGGTLPILPTFKQLLGADSVLMGFCHPNCNAHSPDEFFELKELLRGAKTAVVFHEELSHRQRPLG